MVLLVSPAAKLTGPVGNAAPKSAAVAGLLPLPVTASLSVDAAVVLLLRVTVRVNGVLPLLPSFRLAVAAAIDSEVSSLRMVPMAVAVPRVVPALGFRSEARRVG